MNRVDILEAVKITNNRVKPFDGKKRYLATGNLSNQGIDNFVFVDYENKPSRADLMVSEGDLILARMKATNKIFLIDCDSEDLIVSTGFLTLKPKDGFDGRYLYHYFRSKTFQRLKDSYCSGATQKAINNNSFKKLKVPRYKIEQQKKIGQILDTADNLRQKRIEQLVLLDDYLKSVFLDMFGDPLRNDKSWEIGMIKDYITEKTCNGFFAKNDQYGVDTGIPVIWISDFINKFYANVTGLKRVNATTKDQEKYKVKYGDILFCRSSLIVEGIGKVGIVPKDLNEDIMFECHVIKVSIDVTRIIPEFFRVFSDTPYFRQQIMKNSKTATMTTIGQDGIVNNKIYVPSIELQNKFASIVEQVEKTKQKMRDSLEEMDNHFNALMQRYFE